jgi:hypothetical protein
MARGSSLNAFRPEHRRGGDLYGGLYGQWVWMSCECGVEVRRPLDQGIKDKSASSFPTERREGTHLRGSGCSRRAAACSVRPRHGGLSLATNGQIGF